MMSRRVCAAVMLVCAALGTFSLCAMNYARRMAVPAAETESAPARPRIVVGTFNIENFDLRRADSPSSPKGYTAGDAAEVAAAILKSGADVLALQEIEGDETMRAFTARFLPGWKFCGCDTEGTQDQYFLWDPRVVSFEEPLLLRAARALFGIARPFPLAYFGSSSYEWNGTRARLFDRLPVRGDFRVRATGQRFSLVNVHLKSQLVMGGERETAALRNTARRSAQIAALDSLCGRRDEDDPPLLILGDFNADFSGGGTSPDGTTRPRFPLLHLTEGTSYDKKDLRANLDYIGYCGIAPERLGGVKETETRIERRSQAGADHPDHDIITVEVELP